MQKGIQSGLLVARYGAEEVVALMPDSNVQAVMEAAQRILRTVYFLGLTHSQTSLGIVTFNLGVTSLKPSLRHAPENLVRQADLALNRAKELGRDWIEPASV